jgi:hypothetical protein
MKMLLLVTTLLILPFFNARADCTNALNSPKTNSVPALVSVDSTNKVNEVLSLLEKPTNPKIVQYLYEHTTRVQKGMFWDRFLFDPVYGAGKTFKRDNVTYDMFTLKGVAIGPKLEMVSPINDQMVRDTMLAGVFFRVKLGK